ncbi:carboxypeptidase-like regulatory domain-containing protein [Hymenobacter taeanensis]|uniref:Carboxypeptidase-like regulatory domain-containing protein n=1 Tax=Hymenobacter taeanensis TaxID=2735321 RepID=A0A6M6BH55_9BACT|nr:MULTISPECIES: carboxypeptidase-like regulatory domain-containing protein [Hymenobacter]QJX47380.1 carboxypeptidase-like regulatory domain-containing protein [Hymenobacter taeanensis]UOQ79280.1 carboxypeptidase-like regulatory domain-containing protein [Hymenobacter sp. 5414T-23]
MFRRWLLLFLLVLTGAGAATAQIRVTGNISDASTRKPVPGASVVIQRNRQGVVANFDGDFSISAANTDTLIFRAVGFKAQRLPLGGTGLSQLIVQIKLQQDTVQLGEVRVTEGRPDRAAINKALRNIRRPSTAPTSAVKRPPAPKPLFPVDSTAPKAPTPTIGSPISLIYEQFSREGKQRQKMIELQAQEAAEKARQARQKYNKNFKDNRGYE